MAAAVLRSPLPELAASVSSRSGAIDSGVDATGSKRRVSVAARRMVPPSAVLTEERHNVAGTSGAGPSLGGSRDGTGRLHLVLMPPSGEAVLDRRELETDELWLQMRAEARADSESEPALVSYLYSTVLAHRSLERALAFHLGNKLSSSTLLSTQLFSLILDTLMADSGIRDAMRADLRAVKARDPACMSFVQCLLNFKGFQACQAYRVAHRLWQQGRVSLALAIQSRVSEVFHVDIHPAARIGKGVLFDHATGLVVGETACIGNDVSILHHVTLGGTGATSGDRHPKIGDGVLIGAGATILGHIHIGECAKIGAGSVVLIDVPARATAVGNPARIVAAKQGHNQTKVTPSETMDHASVANAWSDYVI